MLRTHFPLAALILTLAGGWTVDVCGQVLVQRARSDLPVAARIFPPGIQRGRTTEVVITGERLEGLHAILGPAGVRLARIVEVNDKRARIELEPAADASLGAFPTHLLCKAGLSNPRLLAIDAWPQTTEQEDNNAPATATNLAIGTAANAVLSKADVDYYRFEAPAGERLTIDVEARRLGSALSPTITLYNASGHQLSRADSGRNGVQETRLTHVFESPGVYLVKINDRLFAGSDSSVYRLRIGKIPFAANMFPLGGQRGVKTPVSFSGGCLPQAIVHEVDLSGEVLWQRKQLEIPLGDSEILLAPALFAVGEFPESLEQEPNDAPAQAQLLQTPTIFNGRIDRPGDRDCLRFHVKAGEKLTARVLAQQLGSPLDSVLTITDSSGKELATADDRKPAPREWPVVRPLNPPQLLDDALVEFTAPREDDYLVTVEDLYAHGGANYAYRLELAPAPSDFDLVVQPGLPINPRDPKSVQQQNQVLQDFNGAGAGALTLDRGGTATLLVRAFRNGYNGPVAVKLEGLPSGIQASPGLIPAGQNDATLTLVADFEAPAAAGWVRVVGSTAAEQNASNADSPRLDRLAQQPIVWSSLAPGGVVESDYAFIAVGVSQLGAELAVRGELADTVVPGRSIPLHVSIKRREGYAGEVSIDLLNLPVGLSGAATTIAADRSDAEIQMVAGPELTPGKHQIQIEAALAIPDRKEPVKAVFPLEFQAYPPVSLQLTAQQVEVPQGGSAKVELVLHRYAPVLPIELTVLQLPRGLAAAETAIPADAEKFELTLQADEKAVASPIRRIVQIKAKTKLGDQVIELPALRFAVKVVKRK